MVTEYDNAIIMIKAVFHLSNDEIDLLVAGTKTFILYAIAEDWIKAGFPTDVISLNKPVCEGRSVLDLIRAGEVERSQLLFLGSRLSLLSLDCEREVDNARAKKKAVQPYKKPRVRLHHNGMVEVSVGDGFKFKPYEDWLRHMNAEKQKGETHQAHCKQWDKMKQCLWLDTLYD